MSILIHMLVKEEEAEWAAEAKEGLVNEGCFVLEEKAVDGEDKVPERRQAAFKYAYENGFAWAGFFDPDDYIVPGTYKKLLEVSEDLVVIGAKNYDARKTGQKFSDQAMLNRITAFHNVWLFRTSIWPKLAGCLDGNKSPAWQWDFLAECRKIGNVKCWNVPGMIYRYQQNKEALCLSQMNLSSWTIGGN